MLFRGNLEIVNVFSFPRLLGRKISIENDPVLWLQMLLSFPLHKCVAHQILFHDYQLLCVHEALWDKGAEELLAPSHGVSLLGRDRVRQCVTEPRHLFNVQQSKAE